MKQLQSILILATIFTFHSCNLFNMDNDPTLPDITQEGKGTFGCMIDGELFIPKGPDPTGGFRGNPHAKFIEVSGTLRIIAQNTDTWSVNLSGSTGIFSEGEYEIRNTGTVTNLLTSTCNKYLVDTTNSSLIINYLETDLDIVSGVFSGQFINECDSTIIIQVTDGRFDLTYTL